MSLTQTIKIAFKNITSNKLRSALTMIGLVIGISSVIILVGIGKGSSTDVTSEVSSLGTNILTVTTYNQKSNSSLLYSDMDDIKELSDIKDVSPYTSVSATVSNNSTTMDSSSIIATDSSYMDVLNLKLTSGRFLSFIDLDNKSKVCVIGSDVASELFGVGDITGETLLLDGEKYTVVGTLKSSGSSNGVSTDTTVFIPITTAKAITKTTSISNFYVSATDEDAVNKVEFSLDNYLSGKFPSSSQSSSKSYNISTQSDMLETMDSISSSLSTLLAGIAGISLIVGGIGVMNVMLVSVSERTKEIGIRKALGGKKIHILSQFLIEALVLSLLGGILGILIGIIGGAVCLAIDVSFIFSVSIMSMSFLFSLLIGLVFGIFPAYKASCLTPIIALRQN